MLLMSTRLQIREAARRAGITPALLRAWESRYGVVTPTRSDAGYRLYSEEDVERITRMRALVENGVAPAEAARALSLVAQNSDAGETGGAEARRVALLAAIRAFDEPELQRLLDEAFTALAVESALRDVVFPLLAEIGDAWGRGDISIAHEHFASTVVRGRLLGLSRGWARGVGPLALLACPPGEEHDLALLGFGIALNRLGWRIAYLGANTPLAEISRASTKLTPVAIAIALTRLDNTVETRALTNLARSHRLLLAGPGADDPSLRTIPAQRLTGDPISAAEELSTRPVHPRGAKTGA